MFVFEGSSCGMGTALLAFFFSKCSVGGFTFVVAKAITAADHGAVHSQARS